MGRAHNERIKIEGLTVTTKFGVMAGFSQIGKLIASFSQKQEETVHKVELTNKHFKSSFDGAEGVLSAVVSSFGEGVCRSLLRNSRATLLEARRSTMVDMARVDAKRPTEGFSASEITRAVWLTTACLKHEAAKYPVMVTRAEIFKAEVIMVGKR